MFPLRCTVRGCGRDLALADRALRCTAGHAFDRAREGYWNLLQPQDRRSSRPGDSDPALDARARWIERGLVDGLIGTLAAALEGPGVGPGAAVADIGSGEGTLTARLLCGRPLRACGVDLSVRGARCAAKRWPSITWVVANADRALPFPDGSIDLLLSIFGRRPGGEMRRVLRGTGRLLAVLPAEDDLIELRSTVAGRGELRERVPAAEEQLRAWFALGARETWRERSRLDRSAIEDALALSYRGARRRERERLGDTGELEVTLAAEVLTFLPL